MIAAATGLSWSIGAWADIAYLVISATTVGFVLFYRAVQRFGVGMASMVSYLVPSLAPIQPVTILGEQPAPLEIVGGAVILAGVRVATVRFKPDSPSRKPRPRSSDRERADPPGRPTG